MVALWNTADRYIFVLWFLSIFFPRLISAVGDWMSIILPHMVWPYCEFRMQVWNVLHAARWKCSTQKTAKNATFGHHRTTLSGYIFATKACIDNRKKIVKQQYVLQMSSQYGELRLLAAETCWRVWGTPANFNGFPVLAALFHGSLVAGVSQTLAALNRGRHLYSAGRPSRWALAHILVD